MPAFIQAHQPLSIPASPPVLDAVEMNAKLIGHLL
jgi:hypothetical protein